MKKLQVIVSVNIPDDQIAEQPFQDFVKYFNSPEAVNERKEYFEDELNGANLECEWRLTQINPEPVQLKIPFEESDLSRWSQEYQEVSE